MLEAKKLVDTTEPIVIVHDDLKATQDQEDTTAIHTKDSTTDTNLSDATTVVAEPVSQTSDNELYTLPSGYTDIESCAQDH